MTNQLTINELMTNVSATITARDMNSCIKIIGEHIASGTIAPDGTKDREFEASLDALAAAVVDAIVAAVVDAGSAASTAGM